MMKPERFSLDNILQEGEQETLKMIASRIQRGAICIYPTDTIYGIGGRFDDKTVYNRIITAKGKSSHQSMILIGASITTFAPLRLHMSDSALKCAHAFWPGFLTMVVPSSLMSDYIAIRVSNHPFIVALSAYFNHPIFSTSANVSGEPYRNNPEKIYNLLGSRVDFMVDAGILPESLPSTIIKISQDNQLTILREGCIPSKQIFTVINS